MLGKLRMRRSKEIRQDSQNISSPEDDISLPEYVSLPEHGGIRSASDDAGQIGQADTGLFAGTGFFGKAFAVVTAPAILQIGALLLQYALASKLPPENPAAAPLGMKATRRGLGGKLASAATTRLATRSVPGALLFGAGLLAKTLLGRSREKRSARLAAFTRDGKPPRYR